MQWNKILQYNTQHNNERDNTLQKPNSIESQTLFSVTFINGD